jgi:phospholipid-translocating ATPase
METYRPGFPFPKKKKTHWDTFRQSILNWINGVPTVHRMSASERRKLSKKWRLFLTNPMSIFRSNAAPTEVAKAKDAAVRTIHVNTPLSTALIDDKGFPKSRFLPNYVKTAKYSKWSFVPKTLYEQFRRIANIYFLGLAILQIKNLIPDFKANSDFGLAVAPLLVIIAITAFKDGLEDFKRHRSDKQVNNQCVFSLDDFVNVNFGNATENEKQQKTIDAKLQAQKTAAPLPVSPAKDLRFLPELEPLEFKPFDPGVTLESQVSSESLSPVKPDSVKAARSRPKLEISTIPEESESNKSASKSATNMPVSPSTNTIGSVFSKSKTPRKMSSFKLPDEKGWKKSLWRDVRVGDIVKIHNDEAIPADLVILATSEPECLCYIETKNLDGETNLKIRKGPKQTEWIKSSEDLRALRCSIETEEPTSSLYLFNGRMTIYGSDGMKMGETIPLTMNEILLRGCILRNTSYVYGVVVGAGLDTKLMLNSGETPSKRSRIERKLNPHVTLMFAFLFFICIVCTIAYNPMVDFINAIARPPQYNYASDRVNTFM